ncbi:hypothetical protein [Methylobacterium dankookense]|uniref:Uncharacterized protein n=1 Tax=Methylobacterium dankookense TaxID=560405 RepID=A0A564FT74_9HYPH|nr:hypothetical protein [Methylobacterium dankookense]GJD57451.1 hypothetical protein IFDJLNFL_3352 [Methylobacterium dankookense]VUF11253.1 hypothetical protein MTDSW087_00930 [Methylobacterium dankookense]
MPDTPTTGELVKATAITLDEVSELIAAYGAKPGAGPLPLGESYKLDVDAAIDAHPFSAAALADGKASIRRRRSAVEAAILLARPVKA